MSITYDAGTEIILVTGTGNTIQDIYDADILGSWGVVSKQGDNQYLIEAHLDVGVSGTVTDLTSIGNQVTIGTSTAHKWLKWNTDSTLQFGTLEPDGFTTTYGAYGNSLIIWFPNTMGYQISNGTLKLYGCYIKNENGLSIHWRPNGIIDFKNVIQNGPGNIFYSCSGVMDRFSISTVQSYGFMCYTSRIELNDILINNIVQGWVCGYSGMSPILKNSKIRTEHYDRDIVMNPYGHGTFSTYDCDYNIYAIRTYVDATNPNHMKDYKTFNLKLVDNLGVGIENVNVKITNNQGGETIIQTDINGEIIQQDLLNFDLVNNGTGAGSGIQYNTYVFYTPHIIEVYKNGLTTLTLIIDTNEDKYKSGIQLQLPMETPVVPAYEELEITIEEDNLISTITEDSLSEIITEDSLNIDIEED